MRRPWSGPPLRDRDRGEQGDRLLSKERNQDLDLKERKVRIRLFYQNQRMWVPFKGITFPSLALPPSGTPRRGPLLIISETTKRIQHLREARLHRRHKGVQQKNKKTTKKTFFKSSSSNLSQAWSLCPQPQSFHAPSHGVSALLAIMSPPSPLCVYYNAAWFE